MKSTTLAAALVALLVGSSVQAAPLVANGDFSSSAYGSNNQFGTGFGGQGVTSWTGNGGYNLYFTSPAASSTVNANSLYSYTGNEKLWGPVPASPTGGAFVGLDGDISAQSAISQTISGLVSGQTYQLAFSWAAGQLQSRQGATTEQLQVSLGSQTLLTPVVSNPSEGFTGWFTTTLNYTASATSEVLSFLSIGTPSGLPPMALLDGVSLTSVPEPASLALVTLPLVGLAIHRRRRNNTTTA